MSTDPPALRRADWERPERDLSRPDAIAQRLAALATAVKPGKRLGTKDELRILCGVSVGTFNEALRIVQARGLVTVRRGPGGGLFAERQSPTVRLGNAVLALDEDATPVAEAIRLRNALDPLLIEDALAHATSADVTEMRAHLERMKAAAAEGDADTFLHANWALHARIAETTPSRILRSFYLGLLEMAETHTLSVSTVEDASAAPDLRLRYQLHADLVDAIADRDRRALDLIRAHNTDAAGAGGA